MFVHDCASGWRRSNAAVSADGAFQCCSLAVAAVAMVAGGDHCAASCSSSCQHALHAASSMP
jgi:hypothetical protein